MLEYPGTYSGLQAAHDQLYRDWLPNSDEEPADRAVFETYRNTPMGAEPGRLRTEIKLPPK